MSPGGMVQGKKCYDSFALFIQRKMYLDEEKKRIAQKLFELTDLSLRQISEIVGLSEKKLQKLFYLQERGKAKYQLSKPETTTERLFRQINANLTDMKRKNEEL